MVYLYGKCRWIYLTWIVFWDMYYVILLHSTTYNIDFNLHKQHRILVKGGWNRQFTSKSPALVVPFFRRPKGRSPSPSKVLEGLQPFLAHASAPAFGKKKTLLLMENNPPSVHLEHYWHIPDSIICLCFNRFVKKFHLGKARLSPTSNTPSCPHVDDNPAPRGGFIKLTWEYWSGVRSPLNDPKDAFPTISYKIVVYSLSIYVGFNWLAL